MYLIKMLGKLNKTWPTHLRNARVDNVKFRWADFASVLYQRFYEEVKMLRRFLRNLGTSMPDRHKPVVILSGMHWNMKHRMLPQYLLHTRRLATLVKQVISGGKIRIIYVSSVPWPNNLDGFRNLYIVRALNSIAVSWMRAAGAQVLDISDFLYAVNDYNVCGGHYMCVIPRTQKVEGIFGQIVADTIIKEICNTGRGRTSGVSRKGQKGQNIFRKREISISKQGYKNNKMGFFRKGYSVPAWIFCTHYMYQVTM